MAPQSQALARTYLFRRAVKDWELSSEEHLSLVHQRAKTIATSFNFDIQDVLTCSEKFWESNIDPIIVLDGAATTLWTIQSNLACGTVSHFAENRPDLQELCRQMLSFEVSAQYMLTEIGHGLNTQNLETRAHLLSDGTFDLYTPSPAAAKFMPPTLPAGGLPRIGIVMARLIIDDTDHGIRPFVVPLNDGENMYPSVSCRVLPRRTGTRPVGHSITYFNHVSLPATALLGSLESHLPPRIQFLSSIWRVGIGSAALSGYTIPALRLYAYNVATYSQRRMVTNSRGEVVPIISFRSTQKPILRALAQAAALEALFREIRVHFTVQPGDMNQWEALQIRNAFAAIFKTTSIYHFRASSLELADRLGAQGLFVENQLSAMEHDVRGLTIAEGDITVLCIRLASELLLGRYIIPPARDPTSPLALHERGIFQEMQTTLKSIGGQYRSEEFNRLLLPRSTVLVQAIGHRMVYEAAVSAGVRPALVKLYEAGAIIEDLGWYIENKAVGSRKDVFELEEQALTEVYAILDELLAETGMEAYASAPILSEESWEEHVKRMPLLKKREAAMRDEPDFVLAEYQSKL